MAQLRESTTIGGSIAITAKNIHEYLDNVVIEGVGGGLELNKHTFEEYAKIHNITDLDQLSTANDSGLYLTTGGITNPPVALYGSITLPPILTGAYWKPKMFEVDTSYFLTKSPMSDASIILIFNRSNKPTTKDMIILCYHLRTNVWYQMEQNPSTGKFSKKWEVKREIEREFRAFDKVEGALKALSDKLAQTDKNVGVHGTRLTNVEALAVENKNETIAIRKDVVPKSDVVQTIGTSTSRVMSQKAIRDYTDSVGNTTGKFMREGAYGLGSISSTEVYNLSFDYDVESSDTLPNGFYRVAGGSTGFLPHKNSGDSLIKNGWGGTYWSALHLSADNRLSMYSHRNGVSQGWVEFLSDGNTTTDKNNVLYAGTTKPLDSLNTSNIVTTTGTSTVNAMSQKTVTDELNKKITGGTVVQDTGTSTVNVPSQKFVTDEFKKVNDNLNTVIDTTVVELEKKIDTKITGGSVVQTTGTSTTNVPSQKVFTDEVNKKLTAGVLTNVEGTSTTNVMSQKGVTDGLNKRITGGSVVQTIGTSTVNVMSQKATTDQLKLKRDLTDHEFSKTLQVKMSNYPSVELQNESVADGVFGKSVKLETSTNGNLYFAFGTKYNTSTGQRTVTLKPETGTIALMSDVDKKITDHGSLGTKNLDTVIQYGMHHQTANANATTARKYPVALAGTLWVLPSAGVTQVYITYTQGQRTYTRNNYGGKWDVWVENLDTSDILNALGTATNKVASQKIVNDVSTRTTTAQSRADNAWTLGNNALAKAQNLKDLANVTTARTNLGLGNSAIRNLTTKQGTSTTLVATQKLVNYVKLELNTEIGKKITGGSVVQSTGTSTTNVMSQKAVSDRLNSIEGSHGLGYGQQWVDVTRATHQNTSNKPIAVSVSHINDGHGGIQISEDNSTWLDVARWSGGENGQAFTIVPIGWWYRSSQGNMWVLK